MTDKTYSAALIICSDRSHQGFYEDRSGPAASQWLEAHGYGVKSKHVIPDDGQLIAETLLVTLQGRPDLVVLAGGTGLSPRDVTPQVLDEVCDYAVPGIGELLRRESLRYSLNAYLSRCGGWVKDGALVLALPGNPKAVTEQLGILQDLLPHALSAVKGACKHRRKPEENREEQQHD